MRGPDDFETVDELIDGMNRAIVHGFLAYVKWTCPECGQRCASGEPNVFRSAGYYHDEPNCGALYKGPYFGLALVASTDPRRMTEIIGESYRQLPGYAGRLPGLNSEHN